jgi:hypothetical protein
MEDGTFHYTPVMDTTILPVISGWFTFRLVLREMKRARDPSGFGPNCCKEGRVMRALHNLSEVLLP